VSAGTANQELLARAREGPPDAETLGSDARPLIAAVLFRSGRRWFAARAGEVREVVVRGYVTRLPRAPAHLTGVTLVQGRLVPVVDLRTLLQEPAASEPSTMLPRLVVLAHGELEVGIAADETRGVLEIEEPAKDRSQPGVVAGESTWEGQLVSVLDTAELLAACRK
jgi:purine-binding chemotaxis protein CheW